MSTSLSARFASGTDLHAYRVQRGAHDVAVHLHTSARQADYRALGYSLVIVDQVTGGELARQDLFSRGQLLWLMGADWRHSYRETLQVALPADMPANRAYWILLTQWQERDGFFATQALSESRLPRLSDTQLIIGETLRRQITAASSQPIASFDGGLALTGVDMPSSAARGQSLPIAFSWRADAAGADDFIQFLHLFHEESGQWHVYDQQPLGARLPTRLWYAGLSDSESWQLPLPVDMPPGEYQVFTGLYRHSDQQRLPAARPDGSPWPDNRVALGILEIE